MLSFIYGLTVQYEREHGHPPNRLYLNREHLACLHGQLESIQGLAQLERFLGMEIVLSPGYRHPGVAWSETASHWPLAG